MGKLKNANTLKCAMMLLVVLYHSMCGWVPSIWGYEVAFSSDVVNIIALWLNTFHVYVFVFISGYIFAYLQCENSHYSSFLAFAKKKNKRLLIPYFLTVLLWVLPNCLFFNKPFSLELFIVNYLKGYNPAQLWFILMLFWVSLLGWILIKIGILELKKITFFTITFLIYMLYFILLRTVTLPLQLVYTFKFLPYYLIGAYFRFNSMEVKSQSRYRYLILDIVLFVLYLYVRNNTGLVREVGKAVVSPLVYYVGILMAYSWNEYLSDLSFWDNSYVKKLMQYSFTIYLIHEQIIVMLLKLFTAKLYPILGVLINFGITLFISLLISMLIDSVIKYSKKLLKGEIIVCKI